MFDLRYHVASLAAVFFALVIGILVGVALASHGLGNAERKKLEAELHGAPRGRADTVAPARRVPDPVRPPARINRLIGTRQ